MLSRFFGRTSEPTGTLVVARLNDRMQPMDRGERYEDPLQELLAANGWGEVSGGGSQLSEDGEIMFCDLELELAAVTPDILRAIADKLDSLGAPIGSRILSEPELSLGSHEGLGIYLNGTDLPDETYQNCDVDVVYSEFNRLLTGIGSVHSHWQGPTETALYVYGRTAGEMRAALQPFLDSYPLCQRARVVQIAPAPDGDSRV
jgi:hypothetical protein